MTTIAVGSELGNYIVQSALGAGCSGAVYRAVEQSKKRPAVLTVAHPEFLATNKDAQGVLQRAQAAMALNHPNIAKRSTRSAT